MTDYIEFIEPGLEIGLIDADLLAGGTRHPNLALMKISAYCKDVGCHTHMLMSYDEIPGLDIVFVSKVFTFTDVPEGLESYPNVFCG